MHTQKTLIWLALALLLGGCTAHDNPEITLHNPKGTLLAALSEDGSNAILSTVNEGIQWWQLDHKKLQYHWQHQNGMNTYPLALDIARRGPFAATLDSTSMIIWDADYGDSRRYFALPSPPTSVALSGSAHYALVGFRDHTAKLYDLAKGNILRVFQHADRVNAVALSSNGLFAAIGSDDTAVRLWDLESGTMLAQWFHPGRINHLAFSPDNTLLLSASSMQKAWILDIKDKTKIIELRLHSQILFTKARPFSVTASAFSPSSKILATGHPQSILYLWDTTTGRRMKKLRIPKETWFEQTPRIPLALRITPDEKWLICECSNGKAYKYRLGS